MAKGYSSTHDHTDFLDTYGVELIVTIYGGFIGVLVLVLLLFQLCFVAKNLTTNEYVKSIYEGMQNPFDEGCWNNCAMFWKRDTAPQNATVAYYNQLLQRAMKEQGVDVKSKKVQSLATDQSSMTIEIPTLNSEADDS